MAKQQVAQILPALAVEGNGVVEGSSLVRFQFLHVPDNHVLLPKISDWRDDVFFPQVNAFARSQVSIVVGQKLQTHQALPVGDQDHCHAACQKPWKRDPGLRRALLAPTAQSSLAPRQLSF